jgi:predicted ATPase
VSPAKALAAAVTRRYSNPVLVAPPWEDIYRPDEMRRATFELVGAFHQSLLAAYDELAYEIVELPKTPIEVRRQFVTELLELSLP